MEAIMARQLIGLRRYLYTFKTVAAAKQAAAKLEHKGTITPIFINNAYGFEYKENRRVCRSMRHSHTDEDTTLHAS
jgi:hypothetical protein